MVEELLEQVNDQPSFFVFVEALIVDYEQNAEQWENVSLPAFLEAALAWAKDAPLDSQANWRSFAEFLYAGTLYE